MNIKKDDYLKEAENLKESSTDLVTLISNIQLYLNLLLSDQKLIYEPQSILESRFTPANVALKVRMRSCGSVTNIATEMLRHLCFEVKKVHGNAPASDNHAWFKVYDSSADVWVSFDITLDNPSLLENYKELAQCDDWEDIADTISNVHLSQQN